MPIRAALPANPPRPTSSKLIVCAPSDGFTAIERTRVEALATTDETKDQIREQMNRRDRIAGIRAFEYSRLWTVADQADQPLLQLTCCRRCD